MDIIHLAYICKAIYFTYDFISVFLPIASSKMVEPGNTHCLVPSLVKISILCASDLPANSGISKSAGKHRLLLVS